MFSACTKPSVYVLSTHKSWSLRSQHAQLPESTFSACTSPGVYVLSTHKSWSLRSQHAQLSESTFSACTTLRVYVPSTHNSQSRVQQQMTVAAQWWLSRLSCICSRRLKPVTTSSIWSWLDLCLRGVLLLRLPSRLLPALSLDALSKSSLSLL